MDPVELVWRLAGAGVGNGWNDRTGASVAAGIHFRAEMALVARSNPFLITSLSGATNRRDPTALAPPEPQVMVCGLGSGLALTASARPASRVVAKAAKAGMTLRIVSYTSGTGTRKNFQ